MTYRSDVYGDFDRATADLSAYAILDKSGVVGRVVLKFSRSGGRVTAYVQVFGATMAKAFASGYGYDKSSPAVAKAFAKALANAKAERAPDGRRSHLDDGKAIATLELIAATLEAGGEGYSWAHKLEGLSGWRCFNVTG